MRDRRRGALLGLAVGDALGAPFDKQLRRAAPFPALNLGPLLLMKGGGPLELRPGQVTERTQLATCLSHSLRQSTYDARATIREFLAWKECAFEVSEHMQRLMELLDHPAFFVRAGEQEWVRSGRRSEDHSVLARVVPIAVRFFDDPARRTAVILEHCALTHYSPRCQLSCVIFGETLARAIHEPTATPKELIDAGGSVLVTAAAELGRTRPDLRGDLPATVEALREDLAKAQEPDPLLFGPELYMHRLPTNIRAGLRLVYWELAHAPGFEAAVIDVVCRGGESSANAALTGALFGARGGEGAIPRAWAAAVRDALKDLDDSPLRRRFHPNQLLELVP